MTRRTILVPLDGSAFSRQVLPCIRRLFDPTQYELMLLRVAAPLEGITGVSRMLPVNSMLVTTYDTVMEAEHVRHPIYVTQIEDSERATLERELDEDACMLRAAGYHVTVAVRFGDPTREILASAKHNAVDAIAMATHGRGGVLSLVLGSVAGAVMRHAAVPVSYTHLTLLGSACRSLPMPVSCYIRRC